MHYVYEEPASTGNVRTVFKSAESSHYPWCSAKGDRGCTEKGKALEVRDSNTQVDLHAGVVHILRLPCTFILILAHFPQWSSFLLMLNWHWHAFSVSPLPSTTNANRLFPEKSNCTTTQENRIHCGSRKIMFLLIYLSYARGRRNRLTGGMWYQKIQKDKCSKCSPSSKEQQQHGWARQKKGSRKMRINANVALT